MINHLYTKEDKSGNTIHILHSTKLSMTAPYSMFLNLYADLVDKNFISPTTSWRDNNTEIIWAEHNGKVIGFLSFLNEDASADATRIFNFYVIPEYRNKGIFRILITEFENISKERNCDICSIALSDEDHSTFTLMKKFGWSTQFLSLQKVVV